MKIIDLSAKIYDGMKVFKGDPKVSVEIVHTYEENSWDLLLEQ